MTKWLMVGVAVVSVGSGSLQAQSSAPPGGAAARTWKMPRTPEGKPNFEGDWVNNTFTPLERPDELKDKAFFTAEEAKAWAERGIARQKAQPADNIHYDDFIWMNEATLRAVTGSRTSCSSRPTARSRR